MNSSFTEYIIENVEHSIKPKYYKIDDEYKLEVIKPCFLFEKKYISLIYEKNLELSYEINKKIKYTRIKSPRKIEVNEKKYIKMIYNRNIKARDMMFSMYLKDKEMMYKILNKLSKIFSNNVEYKIFYFVKMLEYIEKEEVSKKDKLLAIEILISNLVQYIINSTMIPNSLEKSDEIIEKYFMESR